jgi:hypothetical protein
MKVLISVRLDAQVKKDAQKIAKLNNRSLSNLIESLLAAYCNDSSIKLEAPKRSELSNPISQSLQKAK